MSNDLGISDYVYKIFENAGGVCVVGIVEAVDSTVFEIICHSSTANSSEFQEIMGNIAIIGCKSESENNKYRDKLSINGSTIKVTNQMYEVTFEIQNTTNVRNALALLALGRM